ncbi:MAG: hypothetical protein DHS20C14_16660 [Phycisphaeraceae bacterium]|nr:MAG: hypothetical protein DHS20C14_16660 [Phycisphaeraceae bacterium]
MEVLELTSNPGVGMAEMAKVVRRDPALSARVLKTINSSFYGLSSPCGSIERAMAYLGLNTVKSLVLGFSLMESFKGVGEEHDLTSHWRRALYSATSAKIIGNKLAQVDSDEAFTAGLFQDIGAIACLVTFQNKYAAALDGVSHDKHAKAERDMFGFDHAEVGGLLAEKWKLPPVVVEAVRWHHHPEKAPNDHRPAACLAALSTMCAEAMRDGVPGGELGALISDGRRWFGKAAPLPDAFEEIAEQAPVLAKLFGQRVGPAPDAQGLMDRAREQSFEHQLTLEREKAQMAEEVYRDGLTGAFNRKKFDEEMATHTDAWKNEGHPMALLFFDADKFKSVNDTHGHAAGDAVLVELSRVTRETVGKSGMVFRYGGEEFAIILPNYEREDAEAIAERVRAAIETNEVDVSNIDCEVDTLRVTVSIGVSATGCGDPERIDGPDRLVQEADRAVYVAKESGRNAVRVWGHLRNADDVADATKDLETPEAPPEPKAGSGESVSVWLIEDDALAAVLIRTMLRQRRGVEVEWFRTFEGLTKAIAETMGGTRPAPSVVLTDHMLDGGTGVALLNVVRNTNATRDVPVVVITASEESSIREEYERAGADAFVTKERLAREMNKWVTAIVEYGQQGRTAAAA